MKHVLSVLALAATAALATPAFAQTYRAIASGPAESPPNDSQGFSLATIDLTGLNLIVDLPFRDLQGTTQAAHIHCCTSDPFTGTTGVAVPFKDFPTDVQAGSYSAAIPLYEESSYAPEFLAAHGGSVKSAATALVDGIVANEAYVNIHTSTNPNGEIRGFLVAAPVPEPAEWAMLAGGLAGLLWMGRRRRWELSWQK
jgi:hypothetical protein